MLEIGITFLILLFFIFPAAGSAVCLGAWTCYLIYGKLHLLRRQPSHGKKIVWVYFLTRGIDIVLSFVMACMLALTVYFLIFDSLRLFIFNLIFCFLISFRWFDFSHVLYRRLVLKLQALSLPPPKDSVFCMLIGQRSGSGLGIGMKAVSLDSGYTYWDGHHLIFEGIMARKTFSRKMALTVETLSSEKIKIIPAQPRLKENAEAWILVLRQQFYPFKTRGLRDQWLERLSGQPSPQPRGFPVRGDLQSARFPSA